MSIIYALVARGATVLAEHTDQSGNFQTITQVILEKIPVNAGNTKMTYVYDRHLFHYICDGGLIFLCMADEAFGRRVPFAFLADLKDRFQAAFKARAGNAPAYSLNRDFGPIIKQQMEYYGRNPNSDRINAVRDEVNQVKDVMVQNIEKVLDRGEKIEVLVDKTEDLTASASTFKTRSTQLKRTMWWKNVKLMLIIALIVVVIIALIALGAAHKL